MDRREIALFITKVQRKLLHGGYVCKQNKIVNDRNCFTGCVNKNVIPVMEDYL